MERCLVCCCSCIVNESFVDKATDPPDDELQAAFEQYGREKHGTGLNASEQLGSNIRTLSTGCIISMSIPTETMGSNSRNTQKC